MFSKRIGVYGVPCAIIPPIVLLDIVAVMVAVDMEPDTCIVLACDWNSIDVQGHLLFGLVVKNRDCSEPAMLSISSSQEVSINIKAC